jgi:hypothetical protein
MSQTTATPTERPATPATDPVLLEVVRYRLESIVEEMQWSLIRGSFSPVVKEALDASCSLFDAEGTVIAQSRSNPSHLGSLVFSVRSILSQYPVSSMEDGDVFIMNDPYLGGTHLPDITVIMPVFLDADHADAWLDPAVDRPRDVLDAVLDDAPRIADTLAFHPVDRAVGNVRNDSPALIDPV